MNLGKILTKDGITADMIAKTKKEALAELVNKLLSIHPELDREELIKTLEERERMGSTGIGNGVAIPHGKLRTLERIVGVFGRSRKGVDFESLDGKPVHLFFLYLGPEDTPGDHLKALAKTARLVKKEQFRKQIIKANNEQEIFEMISINDSVV